MAALLFQLDNALYGKHYRYMELAFRTLPHATGPINAESQWASGGSFLTFIKIISLHRLSCFEMEDKDTCMRIFTHHIHGEMDARSVETNNWNILSFMPFSIRLLRNGIYTAQQVYHRFFHIFLATIPQTFPTISSNYIRLFHPRIISPQTFPPTFSNCTIDSFIYSTISIRYHKNYLFLA